MTPSVSRDAPIPSQTGYEPMRQDAVITPPEAGLGNAAEMESERRSKRLAGADRRIQVLEVAAAQFAKTGLHRTTTEALAKAAGISEPVLYDHFSSKECLFRAAVEANIENRLAELTARLASIPPGSQVHCIESMAEATVAVCVSGSGNAVLTNWALLEAPEYAVDLYRNEIGSAGIVWGRELVKRFPESPSLKALSIHLGAFALNLCMAYGFWLATLRHTAESAAPLTRHFAVGIAEAASAILAAQNK